MRNGHILSGEHFGPRGGDFLRGEKYNLFGRESLIRIRLIGTDHIWGTSV